MPKILFLSEIKFQKKRLQFREAFQLEEVLVSMKQGFINLPVFVD